MSVTMIQFGALPALRIEAADGAQAIVTLFGAHLVSWQTADARQRLFCSVRSPQDGSAAIRGGVPVIFPQFSTRGHGLRHGFARVSDWRLADSGQDGDADFAEFVLAAADLPATLAAAWPFDFELRLRVALHANALDLSLTVRNSGARAFPFSAALHTYFLIGQLDQACVEGLQHVRYEDHEHNEALQEDPALRFAAKCDRVYFQVPGALTLRAGAHTVTLEQDGFTDAVVWNPGAADAAAIADLDDLEYLRFLCIEAALIEPDVLAPGATWRGRHTQRCRAT